MDNNNNRFSNIDLDDGNIVSIDSITHYLNNKFNKSYKKALKMMNY